MPDPWTLCHCKGLTSSFTQLYAFKLALNSKSSVYNGPGYQDAVDENQDPIPAPLKPNHGKCEKTSFLVDAVFNAEGAYTLMRPPWDTASSHGSEVQDK